MCIVSFIVYGVVTNLDLRKHGNVGRMFPEPIVFSETTKKITTLKLEYYLNVWSNLEKNIPMCSYEYTVKTDRSFKVSKPSV